MQSTSGPINPRNNTTEAAPETTSNSSDKGFLFDRLPYSLFTTFMLILGEMKYPHTVFKYQPLPYPGISYIIYIIFCVCMPIIIKNLLIGLSVGDVNRILQTAKMEQHAMQVMNDYVFVALALLPFCPFALLSFCPFVLLPFCPFVLLPFCPFALLPLPLPFCPCPYLCPFALALTFALLTASFLQQVELLLELERATPRKVLRKIWVSYYVEFPNRKKTWKQKLMEFGSPKRTTSNQDSYVNPALLAITEQVNKLTKKVDQQEEK